MSNSKSLNLLKHTGRHPFWIHVLGTAWRAAWILIHWVFIRVLLGNIHTVHRGKLSPHLCCLSGKEKMGPLLSGSAALSRGTEHRHGPGTCFHMPVSQPDAPERTSQPTSVAQRLAHCHTAGHSASGTWAVIHGTVHWERHSVLYRRKPQDLHLGA